MPAPIPFQPSDEQVSPGEQTAVAELIQTMRGIQETTYRDYGHAHRSVHAKSHAFVEGVMEVLPGLPPTLAQGLFARPGQYPVVMRLSTNPGDILDDSVSAPRGLALKVIGVPGERLPGSEADSTQDFVLANAPAFAAPTPEAFANSLKLLAATTDTGQEWKKAFSAALRGAEAVVEAVGGESPTLITMGGQPLVHPLGESFYSQVPFRYGDYVAKFAVVPASAELKALENEPVHLHGRPNGLREAMIAFFEEHSAEWELRVQLRTNAATMPIEDASVPWPESESPYVPVARIRVARQPAWNEARARTVDDGLAFSPWHGLAAHQPLGAVNRSRRDSYPAAARFRGARTGCPMHEPRGALRLSDAPGESYGVTPGREGRPQRVTAVRRATGPSLPQTLALAAGGLVTGVLVSRLLFRNGMPRLSMRRHPSAVHEVDGPRRRQAQI